ncbi:DUF4291 domain-containing protein [Undibacterium cyanobacteriorum]|uniref:DUF4291 domain-containing protein n=1 Tax=Undibacterium cyanobacteriorum TaxID=3073561 RepID=A0ABY9RJR4_9BURK|nr:DUF4291 domain-containing protein [Undibacterium sp. 20NA77.5]WMW80306.1 DUF4291 domain-containing protein [Undibacterium sp. 20NA77.5]
MMKFKNYLTQQKEWPQSGEHIMAHFDQDTIVVYQAYSGPIAEYALKHQRFGGAFSYQRMSWIKPNFLWMMYRSGWAQKQGQEFVLAIRLRRTFFDEILSKAVASSFGAANMDDEAQWRTALSNSEVRLQWDPDHDPFGNSCTRRAIQLGLRGSMLARYGQEKILRIEDITAFVQQQRRQRDLDLSLLETPAESIYIPHQTVS